MGVEHCSSAPFYMYLHLLAEMPLEYKKRVFFEKFLKILCTFDRCFRNITDKGQRL